MTLLTSFLLKSFPQYLNYFLRLSVAVRYNYLEFIHVHTQSVNKSFRREREHETNENNETNEKIHLFRLFRYFRLFRILSSAHRIANFLRSPSNRPEDIEIHTMGKA